MLATERQKYILGKIRENGGVQVEELAEQLDVSLMTIRRDLQKMSQSGQIERCHGGAVIKSEEPYVEKIITKSNEKEVIAKRAAELVNEGDCIYLDAGTTTFHMLKFLTGLKKLTIVTNDLEIGYQANKMNFEVIISGGKVQKTTSCMLGLMTNDTLRQIKFDQVFLGAATIDEQFDVLTPTEIKASYKRIVVENSNYSYLLVDSGKFNKRAMIKINNLKDYTGVITTYQFNQEEKMQLEEKNIFIIPVSTE